VVSTLPGIDADRLLPFEVFLRFGDLEFEIHVSCLFVLFRETCGEVVVVVVVVVVAVAVAVVVVDLG